MFILHHKLIMRAFYKRLNHLGGVMVNVLISSPTVMLNQRLIGICYFSINHAALVSNGKNYRRIINGFEGKNLPIVLI